MAIDQSTITVPLNDNNPSKEIWASSGIYNEKPYASLPYASDVPQSLVSNTGIQITTTSTTKNPDSPVSYSPNADHSFRISLQGINAPLNKAMLSDSNYFVDDMLVFNKYISYNDKRYITFDPQSFLEQSIVNFNIYSLEYR